VTFQITNAAAHQLIAEAARTGYDSGFNAGWKARDAQARTEAEQQGQFADIVARRVRAADVLEDRVQQSIKAALAGRQAQAARAAQRQAGGAA
jgi:hypothetical protein